MTTKYERTYGPKTMYRHEPIRSNTRIGEPVEATEAAARMLDPILRVSAVLFLLLAATLALSVAFRPVPDLSGTAAQAVIETERKSVRGGRQ